MDERFHLQGTLRTIAYRLHPSPRADDLLARSRKRQKRRPWPLSRPGLARAWGEYTFVLNRPRAPQECARCVSEPKRRPVPYQQPDGRVKSALLSTRGLLGVSVVRGERWESDDVETCNYFALNATCSIPVERRDVHSFGSSTCRSVLMARVKKG